MHGHVILGERGIHDPPGALVKRNLLHEREAEAHDYAAAKLARRRLGVEDPAAIKGAEEAAHAQFACDDIHPNLAEQRAVAVHRSVLQLERHWRFRFDRHLLALGPAENRSIAFPPGLIVKSA